MQLNTVNIAFYGNNKSAGGNTQDRYPNQGSYIYSFGGAGVFGELLQIANLPQQSSPASHQPVAVNVTPVVIENTKTNSKSGGGSFSWLVLVSTLLLFRKRLSIVLH